MNREKIVKWTVNISMVSILLLLYWVFVFVCMIVFDFKVFKENLTETFYFSILGILAVLFGALITNVLLNLSRIADSISDKGASEKSLQGRLSPLYLAIFLISFPLILGGLYAGDKLSLSNKKQYLMKSAETLVERNRKQIDSLSVYSFDKSYLNKVSQFLEVVSNENKDFPSVSLIFQDSIEDRRVILRFTERSGWPEEGPVKKSDYMYPCSPEERQYFDAVFAGTRKENRFDSKGGFYQLYYPIESGGRRLIVYFTDSSEYGKIGS